MQKNTSEKKKKSTISDVANYVGVSKTTISRYLNGNYGFMSKETQDKISEAINILNYRPNKIAQTLKAKNSNIIGITIADIGNPFSAPLIKGINDVCRSVNYQLLVTNADNTKIREKENIESLLDAQVDGILINTVGNNSSYLQEFKEDKGSKPFVLVDRLVEEFNHDSVVTNNEKIMKDLLYKLIENEYNHIVFLTEEINGITTRLARKNAIEDFIDSNFNVSGETIILDKKEEEENINKIIKVLDYNAEKNICLFANNDDILKIIIKYLFKLKINIGVDVGVCAFADYEWASLIYPGITCIDQNPYKIGKRAATILLRRISDEVQEDIINEEVQATIKLGNSTRVLGSENRN